MTPESSHVVHGEYPVNDATLRVTVDFGGLNESHRSVLSPATLAEQLRKAVLVHRLALGSDPNAEEGASRYYTERYIILPSDSTCVLQVTLNLPTKTEVYGRGVLLEEAVTKATRWLLQTLQANGPHPA
jgi:hypothetical protein